MTPKIYIDGEYGTTGLRIRKWLSERSDLELLAVPEAKRKDSSARREQILADLATLRLPVTAEQLDAALQHAEQVGLSHLDFLHRLLAESGRAGGMPPGPFQQAVNIGRAGS